MLAAALQAEAEAYIGQFAGVRDENGRRLVVRNGCSEPRTVLTSAGAVEVAAPRVNDKRTDPETGERMRFSSAILPPWARKTPQVSEVLPLLYLHGVSSGDFVPALGQFPGSSAGLPGRVITRLTGTGRPWPAPSCSVTSRHRRPAGAYLLYLNATPQQGEETLQNWATFRLELLREDDASSAHEVSAAQGIRFHRGTGSCVIGDRQGDGGVAGGKARAVRRLLAQHRACDCLVGPRAVGDSLRHVRQRPCGPGGHRSLSNRSALIRFGVGSSARQRAGLRSATTTSSRTGTRVDRALPATGGRVVRVRPHAHRLPGCSGCWPLSVPPGSRGARRGPSSHAARSESLRREVPHGRREDHGR